MKLLDPKNDAVFKMLFAKKGNEDILISLITAIIQPKSPISKIKVLNPEIPKKHIDDKGTLLDIRVQLENAEQINIEMQMNWHRYLEERAYYYAARLYASQLERGFKYEKLKPTITIFLLRDIAFKKAPSDVFHYVFSMKENKNIVHIKDMMQIQFVEISKFFEYARKNHSHHEALSLAKWCQFLYNPSDLSYWGDEPMDAIKKALKSLEEISADEEAREIARVRDKARLDFESEVHGARLDGIEIGRKQGRAEGKAEGKAEGRAEGKAEGQLLAKLDLVKKLLHNPTTMNMSNKQLSELSGLSIDQVKNARKD